MVNPDTVFWLKRQLEMEVKKSEQLREKYSTIRLLNALKIFKLIMER